MRGVIDAPIEELQAVDGIGGVAPVALKIIRAMVSCFAVLFGWYGQGRGEVTGALAELARYVDEGIMQLARRFVPPHPLALELQKWVGEIAALQEGAALDLRPADFFYRLLALDPFFSAVRN